MATTILLKMHGAKFMWITCVPLVWLVSVTFTAAWQKIFSPVPAIGFLAQADALEAALRAGKTPSPATATLIFNARLDAAICGIFMVLVAVILIDSLRVWAGILWGSAERSVHEAPFVLSATPHGGIMRRFARLLLALLRELADENAYQRHLAAHGRTAFRPRVAPLQRRAPARQIRPGQVLLVFLQIFR